MVWVFRRRRTGVIETKTESRESHVVPDRRPLPRMRQGREHLLLASPRMTGEDDICAQQRHALAEFRRMANTVIQLDRASTTAPTFITATTSASSAKPPCSAPWDTASTASPYSSALASKTPLQADGSTSTTLPSPTTGSAHTAHSPAAGYASTRGVCPLSSRSRATWTHVN